MINCDIKRIIDEFPHFGIAVSGGSDSMALLTWVSRNYDTSRYDVINIEHGIRGDNSLRDTQFVQQYCNSNKINCYITHVNAPAYAHSEGYTIEQAARILRHKVFEDYHRRYGYNVMTAHHADDQAESIIMHIARGCGINGLCGMSVIDGYLIRPLINTDKATIANYIVDNKVPFVYDETNDDSAYNRNFIRKEVLPLVKTKYPSFKNNLLRLGKIAEMYENFAEQFVPHLFVDSESAVSADLRNMHALIAYKTINQACNLLGVGADIEEKHYHLIMNLKDNDCINLPHGLRVYGEYGKTIFVNSRNVRDNHVYAFGLGEYDTGYGMLKIQTDIGIGFKQIDADKLPADTVIRTRQEGDKIELDYGTKSVGKLLTDKKIPRRLKDLVPIIASGNSVLLIGDIAVAESVKTDSNTRTILNIKWNRSSSDTE